jgi:hypothetical protein
VKRSLEPLVRDVDLEALTTTQRANGFNWIDLLAVLPISYLDESIVQRCTILIVLEINVDTSVDEELLSFKSSISSRTRHVNCMVEKIASLVVNLVDVGSKVKQLLDGIVLSSDKCIFESKETTCVHLVNIGSQIKHLISELEVLLLIEIQERSAALPIWEVYSDIQL